MHGRAANARHLRPASLKRLDSEGNLSTTEKFPQDRGIVNRVNCSYPYWFSTSTALAYCLSYFRSIPSRALLSAFCVEKSITP